MQIAAFDRQSAIALGSELRRRCRGDVSVKDAAEALLETVDQLEHGGIKACVAVQLFATRALSELPAATAAALRAKSPQASSDTPSLQLMASRGVPPLWNAAEPQETDVLLLTGPTAPLVAELVRQLEIGKTAPQQEQLFYIADATASPAVAAKELAASSNIRSIVGFAATPWTGEALIVVCFLRTVVERAIARTLATLTLYTKLVWLDTREARAALGENKQHHARTQALEELLHAHETHIHDLTLESNRRVETIRDEAQRAADSGAQQIDAQHESLRRTQRAMLNVIEDLREARSALAQKVTERTRELAEANSELETRNRELEEFVYIASHDLQEPLRTVAGYLQMIERRYGNQLGSEADEFFHFAIDGAQRMQALIESLLLYSRVAKKERVLESVRLDEAVDLALQNLAARIEESGAAIERTPLPRIHADRVQMVQLFQNLISNAIKFAGAKPPRIHITGSCGEGECRVSVRDEGIGFNPKYAERIFQVFRRLRRDTPGTGIGLSICKKIVERHRGRIEAHSAPGEGATFTIHFPESATRKGTP